MNRHVYLSAAVVAAACGAESSSTEWSASREVVGDTTIVHTISGQIWPADVRLEEDLSIGALDGPAELMFGNISRLAEDPTGGIYVFDRQVPEIRRFDSAGTFLYTVGRSGDGPGEYDALSLGMVVDPTGVLYVHDWGNQRLVRFSKDGQVLDPWRVESSFLTTRRGTWLYSDGPGQVLLTTEVGENPALLVLQDGATADTLIVPRLPGVPQQRGGPYRIQLYWSWHPDGYFLAGVSDEYSFDLRRSDGVLRIVRNVEELPVHPEEADAIRRQFEWMEQQPNYRAPEGAWLPPTMPPFRGIEVGSDGRIWVQRNTDPIAVALDGRPNAPPPVPWRQPFVYNVFEEDGTFLGGVRFPEQFEPHLFGSDHVWGVRRGDFGEQYVVRLTLRPGEG